MSKMGQSRNGLLNRLGPDLGLSGLHGALSSVRKSRWFYMFGSVTYAKTTPAPEVAGWFGLQGCVDRGELPAKQQEMKLTDKHN